MLSYTVYSEGGGFGKTSLSANLAVAHSRAGLDVLVVPLDSQDGDLSYLLQVDDDRDDGSVDTLVHHLVGRNDEPLEDLIRTTEHGVDVVPEHNRLESLGDALRREQDARADFGESFPMYTQLQRVLRENAVNEDYDVLIVDPPGSSGPELYNGLDATRNLVLPIEPSGKGEVSIDGLEDMVLNLEDELDINIGTLAAVPMAYKGTNDQEEIVEAIRDLGFDIPVVIGERTSLIEGCWKERCSAYRYIKEHRTRVRDYELETVEKFDQLARHLENVVGIEAPDPPEPGDLDHDPQGEPETEPEVEA